MQNIAQFEIIARVGSIDIKEKVTYLSIAANYNRRVDDKWESDTHWNRVSFFGKLQDKVAKAAKGDLVRVTGRVRQNSYEKDGETQYTVDLIAEVFGILAKPSDKSDDESE
ncbi:single-stranded DNA-binding protein [Erythrobacter sp. QSSC1-22B]|uniref:single-stranded DNA-binding protein n=1 Tax=Erythrobacter sp. QSSC1-22B TaxID=1860125 RepID=UPI0008049BE7|nr:single-stranded DNA-binding protein [Erythrobacter sp. QSSC1-22B]OBX17956.1 single-stranded DNA-binding protein [Erythrobacter sp. QSSC1-22B]